MVVQDSRDAVEDGMVQLADTDVDAEEGGENEV